MNKEFSNACNEVLEIFKYVDEKDLKLIPKHEIKWLEANASFYAAAVCYNPKISIAEQNISEMAKAIINLLFKKYVASEEEKNELIAKEREYNFKLEEEKKAKYKYEDLFNKNSKKTKNIEENTQIVALQVKKDNIFTRIKEFFCRIFGKK